MTIPRFEVVSNGFESGSGMRSYVVETLGEPLREEQDDGFWDIDIYEVPRTSYFSGVTVKIRDLVLPSDYASLSRF